MTSLLKKLLISIKIHVVKPFPNCPPNPSAVVVNLLRIVFTADADATQLDGVYWALGLFSSDVITPHG